MTGRLLSAAVAACALIAASGCSGPKEARLPPEPDSTWEAYSRPTAALMWPGATRSFQVTPEGSLYNGEWVVRLEPSSDGAIAPGPRAIAAEERWLPVLHWTRSSGDVRWDFEALALPEPAPRDSGLLVALEARATNRGATTHDARLAVTLAAREGSEPFVAWDAPPAPPAHLTWGGRAGSDTVCSWSALSGEGPARVRSWRLAPGQSRSERFVLPSYPASAAQLSRWARTPQAARAREARLYWTGQIEGGARFELGDSTTESALKAARVILLSCRERRGTEWVPIGGPFHYRDVWLRDGARVVQALAVSGELDVARELAAGLLGFQWIQGAFLSQRGQLDGTGQALWAFEQALLRGSNPGVPGRFIAAAMRAWGWCEQERRLGRESGWPFGKMLPFGDPRDAELVRAQLVGNDAWALAGYRAAERLLRAASHPREADSVRASRERYEADFLAALPPGRAWGVTGGISRWCGRAGRFPPRAKGSPAWSAACSRRARGSAPTAGRTRSTRTSRPISPPRRCWRAGGPRPIACWTRCWRGETAAEAPPRSSPARAGTTGSTCRPIRRLRRR